MEHNIYRSIAMRTGGDIYIGVVGPVRTGKSTFIKKFMEKIVIPHIDSQYKKNRTKDELPQSSAGKTIMTTEPKFIPEEAVKISVENNVNLQVRLIDCVGYVVPSAIGYVENNAPRMVRTPWFEKEIPFNLAAEIGTKKVINEHSTIGLVLTTDGSISDIARDEYEEIENKVINELKEIKKPFIVLLNSKTPTAKQTIEIAESISKKHGVDVVPINCLELDEDKIFKILEKVLYRFPVKQIDINIPKWVTTLPSSHWLKIEIYEKIKKVFNQKILINQLKNLTQQIETSDHILNAHFKNIDLGTGIATIEIELEPLLFYKILTESTGLDVKNQEDLMLCMVKLSEMKKKYEKIENALSEVEATGYGIVMPTMEELTLEEPKIIKQGGKYGVKLKAQAPSIHMMKAKITTEVNPIVGSEKQSEELAKYLLNDFEENPQKIWESNIFGKSLHELVNEGLCTKLYRMPGDARMKMQETIERIINEGCNGLICIII